MATEWEGRARRAEERAADLEAKLRQVMAAVDDERRQFKDRIARLRAERDELKGKNSVLTAKLVEVVAIAKADRESFEAEKASLESRLQRQGRRARSGSNPINSGGGSEQPPPRRHAINGQMERVRSESTGAADVPPISAIASFKDIHMGIRGGEGSGLGLLRKGSGRGGASSSSGGGGSNSDVDGRTVSAPVLATASVKRARKKNSDRWHAPIWVSECVGWLLDHGLREEGLFRVSASLTKTQAYLARFQAGDNVDVEAEFHDPHDVAGLVKHWVKSQTVVPRALHADLISALGDDLDLDTRLADMREALEGMSTGRRAFVAELCVMFARIAALSKVNKMTARNVSLVFAPTLLSGMNHNAARDVLEFWIRHCDVLFAGDV